MVIYHGPDKLVPELTYRGSSRPFCGEEREFHHQMEPHHGRYDGGGCGLLDWLSPSESVHARNVHGSGVHAVNARSGIARLVNECVRCANGASVLRRLTPPRSSCHPALLHLPSTARFHYPASLGPSCPFICLLAATATVRPHQGQDHQTMSRSQLYPIVYIIQVRSNGESYRIQSQTNLQTMFYISTISTYMCMGSTNNILKPEIFK